MASVSRLQARWQAAPMSRSTVLRQCCRHSWTHQYRRRTAASEDQRSLPAHGRHPQNPPRLTPGRERGEQSFASRGVPATVMVLQRWFGLSDREAVAAFEFDVRWKYACGGLDFDRTNRRRRDAHTSPSRPTAAGSNQCTGGLRRLPGRCQSCTTCSHRSRYRERRPHSYRPRTPQACGAKGYPHIAARC